MSRLLSLALIPPAIIYLSSTQSRGLHFLLDLGFDWGTIPSFIIPFLVFGLRTINWTFGTLRMLAVFRGRRGAAWVLGLIQSAFFVTVIAGVLGNLNNPWNILAYAAGYASGNVLGVLIESRLAPGHSLIRIISPHKGNAVLDALHRIGYGATEIFGHGKQGTVSLILCYVPRRRIKQIKQDVIAIDADAFITVDQVRELRGGWRV
jgi:uncharacterized protein YebE (UPF0316 family)